MFVCTEAGFHPHLKFSVSVEAAFLVLFSSDQGLHRLQSPYSFSERTHFPSYFIKKWKFLLYHIV